jgi:hypothetical protein
MTASYAIGTLVGSLPGGVLAVRAGPKFTVCVGLALLACSTVAFALLHNAALLDAARFVDGVGGACSWAGGLAWIVAETPADQRGAMIGRALGAAIGGALFGPVIGTVATATGRPAAFGVLVLAALLLIPRRTTPVPSCRVPAGHSQPHARTARTGCGDRHVARCAARAGLGVAQRPWTLRLHRLGAAAAAIGATYLVAAAIESVISPAVGSLSDRRGRIAPRSSAPAVGAPPPRSPVTGSRSPSPRHCAP